MNFPFPAGKEFAQFNKKNEFILIHSSQIVKNSRPKTASERGIAGSVHRKFKISIEFYPQKRYIKSGHNLFMIWEGPMAIERKEFMNVLRESYSAYYNLIDNTGEESFTDLPLVFKADYLQRGEKYWITKSIPIWGNETNEFCYIFSDEFFDRSMISRCIDYALDDGLPRVKPHKEHQYTNIKTVFIASAFDSDALEEVRSRKFSKSYNHSFWGYSTLLTGAVNLSTEKVVTNRAGAELDKYFRKLFTALKKK